MHVVSVKTGAVVLCLVAGAIGGCAGVPADRPADVALRPNAASLALPTQSVRSIVPEWGDSNGWVSVDLVSRNDARLGTDGPGGIPAVARSFTRFDDRQRMHAGRFFDSTTVRTRTYRTAPGQ
jgi:hypothetical protein